MEDKRIEEICKKNKLDVLCDGKDDWSQILKTVREVIDEAVKEEREMCAWAICEYCRGGSYLVNTRVEKVGDGTWRHPAVLDDGDMYICRATAIRNRGKGVK